MNSRKCLKTYILTIFILSISFEALTQQKGTTRISVSLNEISINSGGDDPGGFAFSVGFNRFLLNTLNLSLEYKMAHVRSKPYFIEKFSEKSVHYLEPKIECYPFNHLSSKAWRNVLGGLNIGIGASAFIGTVSEETFWISYLDSTGREVDRQSRLGFQRIDDFGYVVKVGYEKTLTKKVYLGARMDFSSYIGDDGYIGLGVVVGFMLNHR